MPVPAKQTRNYQGYADMLMIELFQKNLRCHLNIKWHRRLSLALRASCLRIATYLVLILVQLDIAPAISLF